MLDLKAFGWNNEQYLKIKLRLVMKHCNFKKHRIKKHDKNWTPPVLRWGGKRRRLDGDLQVEVRTMEDLREVGQAE